MRTEQYDVVVIGGGGAALRAAIAAKDSHPEASVALLVKGELGKCGVTAIACSDRMAYHATLKHSEPGGTDAWKHHAEDIYRIGGCVSDADLAATLARNSGDSFYYLDSLGVPFAKKGDLADQFVTDGSEYARACYTGPHTANHIEEALVRKIKTVPVKVFEQTMAVDLLKGGNAIAGLVALDLPTGQFILFKTKAVVLATGGAGELFAVNVFPEGMTGDGHAMALRAGAELVNMEFIQIGLSSVKTKLACSGSMFRSLPRLINSDGEEFLLKGRHGDLPLQGDAASMFNILFRKGASWPVSKEEVSNIIDIAVAKENARGKKVHLDYSANPAGLELEKLDPGILKRWQTESKQPALKLDDMKAGPLLRLKKINAPAVQWLRERGIDLDNGDKIELAPACQHFQGGIKIRTQANTNIAGLYAAGEAAGGQHGANRPGGNALMDCQVFGRIAGEQAVAYSLQAVLDPLAVASLEAQAEAKARDVAANVKPSCGCGCSRRIPATEARRVIQEAMSLAAGVVRTEAGIKDALAKIAELKTAGISADDKGIGYAIETHNLLDAGEAVLQACLERRESRGPHLFFPDAKTITPMERSPKLDQYVVLSMLSGRLAAEWRTPVRSMGVKENEQTNGC